MLILVLIFCERKKGEKGLHQVVNEKEIKSMRSCAGGGGSDEEV
jgi:hypothetical protein